MGGHLHVHELPDRSGSAPVRKIRVWTPSNYSDTSIRQFPVLYLQDGQNLFTDPESRSKAKTWRANTTAQRLITAGTIQPLVLVGIDNSGAKRADDYTPVAWRGEGGGADAYADFLVSRVKPFVDRTYRTRLGPESTALGGSSLGGLLALYAGLQLPDVFGGILAMSPSVYWGGDHIVSIAEQAWSPSTRIWLDMGMHETPTMRGGLRKIVAALAHSGWRRDRSPRATLRATEDPKGHHDEASWGRRFGRALRFLFPAKRSVRAEPVSSDAARRGRPTRRAPRAP